MFQMDGSSGTLQVSNGSGAELGPPGMYVVTRTGEQVDGVVQDAAAVLDGEEATFEVTFPDPVTEGTVGLVILLFGDDNYGAMTPVAANA